MKSETFRKYMKAYHIDVSFTRGKEDCCDTCIRLSIAVADPNIPDEERVLLVQAQNQHATDARTQRLALKSAIKVWGKDANSGIGSQHLAHADENLPDTIEEEFTMSDSIVSPLSTKSSSIVSGRFSSAFAKC